MSILKPTVLLLTASFFLAGCATGLNSLQEREYAAYKQDGVLIEEKDPTLGAVLGILPGGGSFYVREPGYGIANLLFWPASILWDPISGYEGAKAINYDITKHKIEKDKKEALRALEDKFTMKQISQEEFIIAKRKIEDQYSY